jgi:hypothetical protein
MRQFSSLELASALSAECGDRLQNMYRRVSVMEPYRQFNRCAELFKWFLKLDVQKSAESGEFSHFQA